VWTCDLVCGEIAFRTPEVVLMTDASTRSQQEPAYMGIKEQGIKGWWKGGGWKRGRGRRRPTKEEIAGLLY
jgi:hypothetical protein